MAAVNTVGTYTLTVKKGATTLLNAASFDMNTLAANTVTDLTLTGTASDLNFNENDVWTIAVASSDVGFNGSGIYIDLCFEVVE